MTSIGKIRKGKDNKQHLLTEDKTKDRFKKRYNREEKYNGKSKDRSK